MVENISKTILSFSFVAFALIGVLFGMNIMSFIFGNLGVAQSTSLGDVTVTVVNETQSDTTTTPFLNSSGYSVNGTNAIGFLGAVSVSQIINSSNGTVIPVAQYTVNVATGLITNATAEIYPNISIDYTYNKKSIAELSSDAVTNNSLGALSTYSGQANTQFSTLAISITLVVLLAVFALFWAFFMGKGGVAQARKSGNFT